MPSLSHAENLYRADVAPLLWANQKQWGDNQSHPDGTSQHHWGEAEYFKARCKSLDAAGTITWLDILREEFFEAAAETEPERIRAELLDVIAVAFAWIDDIDKRQFTRLIQNLDDVRVGAVELEPAEAVA